MASESPHGGDAKAETIRVFTSHEAANVAAANLQAHGIHCWVHADDGGGMFPNLAAPEGVRLLVLSSDAAEAIALLTGVPAPEGTDQMEPATEISSPITAVRQEKFAPTQLLLGIIVGVLLCLFYQWYKKLGNHTYYHYASNGKADKEWVYRDGHEVELLRDRNLDGAWDEWIYYDHGSATQALEDNNFDGKPDEMWAYSNGTLVRMEKDNDFNGTPDFFYTYTNGIPRQLDIIPNGAKFATKRELFENGVLVEILQKPDWHGHFRESVRYDPFFNPISTNELE